MEYGGGGSRLGLKSFCMGGLGSNGGKSGLEWRIAMVVVSSGAEEFALLVPGRLEAGVEEVRGGLRTEVPSDAIFLCC